MQEVLLRRVEGAGTERPSLGERLSLAGRVLHVIAGAMFIAAASAEMESISSNNPIKAVGTIGKWVAGTMFAFNSLRDIFPETPVLIVFELGTAGMLADAIKTESKNKIILNASFIFYVFSVLIRPKASTYLPILNSQKCDIACFLPIVFSLILQLVDDLTFSNTQLLLLIAGGFLLQQFDAKAPGPEAPSPEAPVRSVSFAPLPAEAGLEAGLEALVFNPSTLLAQLKLYDLKRRHEGGSEDEHPCTTLMLELQDSLAIASALAPTS